MANIIQSTMAGIILQISVSKGDEVEIGQEIVLLESMKMEVPVQAELAGKIAEVKVKVGQFVSEGESLVELEM